LPAQANFGKGLHRTLRVGSYQPNRLGLYDLCGNVWEWCDDAEKTVDGAPQRVARGGSWLSRPPHCRAAHRDVVPLSRRDAKLGLRVARVPVGKELVTIPPEEKKPADVVTSPPTGGPAPNPTVTTTASTISGRPFLARGEWTIENDEVVQPTLATGDEIPLLVFGAETLSNYDLIVEAKNTGGQGAMGIFFHWLGPGHYRKFFLEGNRWLNFSYSYNGKWGREEGNEKKLSYSSNRWYSLKVEARGDTFRAYLDGVLQFEQTDARFTHGRICLFTNKAAARFRRFKVSDPQGKVLFEGLPQVAFGTKPPGAATDAFQSNSVWSSGGSKSVLTVTERKGAVFQARFELGPHIERMIKGTVKDGKVEWFAKDVIAIKGRVGGDNHGTITSDDLGDKIDFVWHNEANQGGNFTLRLQK
jgi:hypothetical protein